MANYAHSHRSWTRFALAAFASALLLAAMPLAASAQDSSTASAGGAFTVGSGANGNEADDTGTTDFPSADGSGYAPLPPDSSPTDDQYVDLHTRIQTSTSSTPPSAGGGLPFTGFDVGVVALVGAALLGLGLTVRRFGTRDA